MKKKSTLLLFVSFALLMLSSFSAFYPGGAPAGYTGSPGDGKDCSQCHNNSPATTTGWITSTIPAGGYVAGQTYQITATNNITGSGKYGFEISPQNAAGALLGTLTAGSNSHLVGTGNKYITQSSASSSLKTWTFSWTAPSAGTGNVTFYGAFARNYSGPTTLCNLTVSEQSGTLPGAAGPISGTSDVCKNNVYSYSTGTIAGASTYVWSVPAGASISSGQGTTGISVNFGVSSVSGNISVYGSNASGNGTPGTLAVTVNSAPSQPDAIAGSASPCQAGSQVYSVTNTAGVTYTWSVPAGSVITSGQGTNSITVTIGSTSGNMNVVPSNTCGGGTEQIKTITIQPLPGMAGAISGPDQVDLATVVLSDYTTSGASDAISYQWELSPANAGTISGSGLTGSASWNSGFLGTAQIHVKALNACGEGAWSETKSTTVVNTTGITDGNIKPGFKVYPSPSDGAFSVALSGFKGEAKLRILDITGHELFNVSLPGEGATRLEYPLSQGIYMLLLDEGTKTLRQKLVIR